MSTDTLRLGAQDTEVGRGDWMGARRGNECRAISADKSFEHFLHDFKPCFQSPWSPFSPGGGHRDTSAEITEEGSWVHTPN